MRKILIILLTVCLSCSLVSCGTNEPNKNISELNSVEDTKNKNNNEINSDTTVSNENTPEYQNKNQGDFVSDLGYTLQFDPAFITLDTTTDGVDKYYYNASEQLLAPVSVSIYKNTEMDRDEFLTNIIEESGIEDLEPIEVLFGANSLDSRAVIYQKEIDGIVRNATFHVLETENGLLIIEIWDYIDMPMDIVGEIEQMMGTFCLVSDSPTESAN